MNINNIIPYSYKKSSINDYKIGEFVKDEKRIKKISQNENFYLEIPEDILNLILTCCELNELSRIMLVDKKRYKLLKNNTIILCERILDKFPISYDKTHRKKVKYNPSVHDEQIILETNNHINQFFSKILKNFSEIKQDSSIVFNSLLKNNLEEILNHANIENIHELFEICKARDILLFWEVLQQRINTIGDKAWQHNFKKLLDENPTILQKNKRHICIDHGKVGEPIHIDVNKITCVKELIAKSKEFSKWCDANKENLTWVLTLNLSFRGLISLPHEIGLLKNLISLVIVNNYLTSLPAEICQLKKLDNLELFQNQLRSLPSLIGQLTHLNRFILCENSLTLLPEDLYDLPNLQVLSLNDNLLTSLSPKVEQMKKLNALSLRDNPLCSLPKMLKWRIHPTRLEIEDSKINDPNFWVNVKFQDEKLFLNPLPVEIVNNILHLCDLSEINNMAAVNKNWNKLVKNNKVFLCDLISSKLPFLNLKKIKPEKIIFSNCLEDKKIIEKINLTIKLICKFFGSHFDEAFPVDRTKLPENPSLFDLFVEAGSKRELIFNIFLVKELQRTIPQIEDIHELLEICKARDTLIVWKYFHGMLNQIKEILNKNKPCKELPPNARKLLNENVIGEPIDQDVLNITCVKELLEKAGEFHQWCELNRVNLALIPVINLNGIHLTSFPIEIELLKNLKELNLSGNYLTSLPNGICRLQILEKLSLSDNYLVSLPKEIGKLAQLTKLNLSFNLLKSLPDEIYNLVNLNILSVDENFLSSISPKVGQLKNLFMLDIESDSLKSLPKILKSNPLLNIKIKDSQKNDPNFWSNEKSEQSNSCSIQ